MSTTTTVPRRLHLGAVDRAEPQPSAISPSVAAFAGENWRGPVGSAVQCNSWQDFQRYFGGFNPNSTPVLANPYLAYSVYEYFANGGKTAWIQRIAASLTPGASAAVTSRTRPPLHRTP